VSHRRDARIDAQRCRRYKSNKNKSENTNGEKLVQAQVQAVPRLESASSVAVCPQPAKEVKVRVAQAVERSSEQVPIVWEELLEGKA